MPEQSDPAATPPLRKLAKSRRYDELEAGWLEAVEQDRFHVYAVEHVEQALELLTGLPAGNPDEHGIFPKGTVNHLVQLRLAEWIALRQHYAAPPKTEDTEE